VPYNVGEKGSYGCSGYPVINDADSSVVGCYDSLPAATAYQAWFVAIEEQGSLEDLEEDS
jgi:hypothetical protein